MNEQIHIWYNNEAQQVFQTTMSPLARRKDVSVPQIFLDIQFFYSSLCIDIGIFIIYLSFS